MEIPTKSLKRKGSEFLPTTTAVEPVLKEAFFDAGYNEAALIELIGLVTVRTFTNYVYTLTDIPVDFPAVPTLQ
ncbi:carboxymuconolactone decarboxylase family protein [Xanthocytophaga flava]|uniref:hypothetical protein n=1 Tax=Xanthocytophaga flava TaxID=3048013 RepID=UPI0028D01B98|nr:hypothetical protein [Xanthocytophaga flavus]